MIPQAYVMALNSQFENPEPLLMAIESMFNPVYQRGSQPVRLGDVSAQSLNSQLMQLDALGLMGFLGKGVELVPAIDPIALIPEAIALVGYKPILAMARETGFVRRLRANLVFEHDHFLWRGGNNEVEWRPCKGERGELRCGFVQAELHNGRIHTTLMYSHELAGALEDARDKLFGGFLPMEDQAEYCLSSVARRAVSEWEAYSYGDEAVQAAYEMLASFRDHHHDRFRNHDTVVRQHQRETGKGDNRFVSQQPSKLLELQGPLPAMRMNATREAVTTEPLRQPVLVNPPEDEGDTIVWMDL